MEQAAAQAGKRKNIWIRALAILLALAMLCSLFLASLAQIKLSHDQESEAESSAAKVLEETDFVQQNLVRRMGEVLDMLVSQPTTAADYYQRALIQIGQGAYMDAIESLDGCLSLYTDGETDVLDDIYLKKGCLYALLPDYEAALAEFALLSEGSIYTPEASLVSAQIYVERGEYEKAGAMVDTYLPYYPDDTDMLRVAAELKAASGRYAEAVTYYDRLLALTDTADAEVYILRGSCHMELGNYQEAVGDLIRAKELGYADQGGCAYQIALCSYMLGQDGDVLSYGAEAIETGTELLVEKDLYLYMGIAALRLDRVEEARVYLRTAIEAGAAEDNLQYYYGICCMSLGDYEGAIEAFTEELSQNSGNAYIYYNRALCYIQGNALDEAAADLKTAIAMADLDTETREYAQELLDSLQ